MDFSIYKDILDDCIVRHYSEIDLNWLLGYSLSFKERIELDKYINLITKDSFIIEYDKPAKMINFILKDLIMLDWDEADGISKNIPILLLNRFISSEQKIGSIEAKEMCFKLYETDNGIHAYLISHKINDIGEKTELGLALCSDLKYIMFSRKYGSNSRISRKKMGQFIQKEYFDNGENRVYVGNIKNIDKELDDLTDLIIKTQKFIVKNNLFFGKYDLQKIKEFVLKNSKSFN